MKKVTVDIIKKKKNKEKITMLTAYDYISAKIVDEADIDIILVGDSLAMVVLGYKNTNSVTLNEMLHHAKAVLRGTQRAFVVLDMPFGTYQISKEEAIKNCVYAFKELSKEAQVHIGLKLEGGKDIFNLVKELTDIGIPIMGHIGLQPQKFYALGGYKTFEDKESILEDALALEEAGAFAIVLEKVKEDIAKEITQKLKIPTIGIGAGRFVDGQVLVFHDILGLFLDFKPKFVKRYFKGAESFKKAIQQFVEEVKNGKFPEKKHAF